MDMFHVDIILLSILCFLTVFMCAYGVYCVYRLVVSLQMQILLRPTRVLFSHKRAGQSQEELRTVVAYQNPFSGDYCVHKSRNGPRGYLNTTPSPDSGLSDEYEPLHQPALAHSSVETDNPLGFESLYRQNVESAYMPNVEPAYKQSLEAAYKQHIESAYMPNLELPYQRREELVEPAYHQPGMTNGNSNDLSRQMDPAIMMTVDPPYPRREKPATKLSINGGQASVKLTSTRSLDTSQPSLGWVTHLKSALRRPRHPLKTSSMPSVEHNVIDKSWNWNYEEYQI